MVGGGDSRKSDRACVKSILVMSDDDFRLKILEIENMGPWCSLILFASQFSHSFGPRKDSDVTETAECRRGNFIVYVFKGCY